MKRKNIIPLLVLPLLLTSCGSSNPTALPNKGTQISAADGKANFKKAYQATETAVVTNNGAAKASIEDGYVTMDYSTETKVQNNVTFSSTGSFEIRDFNLTLAANGLTSSDINDYHFYGHTGFKAKYDFESTGYGANTSSKMDEKTYSADVYDDKDYTYVDLSQGDTLNMVKSIVTGYGSYSGGLMVDLKDGKLKLGKDTSDSWHPYISTEISEDDFAEAEKFLLTEEEDGVYKDHGNGTYSYSYSLNGNDINKQEENNDTDENSSTVQQSFGNSNMNFNSSSSVEYAIVYSEKTGITSIGLKGDITFSFANQYDNGENSGYSNTSSYHLTFGLKLSFTYRGNIDVKTVSDPDSYTLIK